MTKRKDFKFSKRWNQAVFSVLIYLDTVLIQSCLVPDILTMAKKKTESKSLMDQCSLNKKDKYKKSMTIVKSIKKHFILLISELSHFNTLEIIRF